MKKKSIMKPANYSWDNVPLVLSADQVALILCYKTSTVRRLRRDGKLKATKLNNGKYLFERDYIFSEVRGDK